jgi:hypothetical protein
VFYERGRYTRFSYKDLAAWSEIEEIVRNTQESERLEKIIADISERMSD